MTTEANKKPVMEELAVVTGGKDITRGYVGDTLLISQDTVLTKELFGRMELYEELLRDDQVKSVFQSRRSAVVSREWGVEAGGDDKASMSAAEHLREQLAAINWDGVTDKMLFGLFYGYAVAELLWEPRDNKVCIKRIKVRKARRFRFGQSGEIRLLTTTSPNGEEMPGRKFWTFCAGADNDDEPYGLGLANALYWPVWFKRNGVKFWAVYLEKFGQPTPIGKFPEGTDDTKKKKLLEAVQAVHTDSGIIIPEGMIIELLEATRSGSADYAQFAGYWDKAIAKVILSQSASTEGTPGSLGSEQVRSDVKDEVIKADADLVCQSFNEGPAVWLTEWNFPGAKPPRVWRKTEQDEDLKARAEREKLIAETAGLKPTRKHVEEVYGGEWEDKPSQPPVQPVPPVKPAEFAEAAAADSVDHLVEDMMGDYEEVQGPLVGELLRRIEGAQSYEEVKAILTEAATDPKVSTEQLQQVLLAGNLAARALGDVEVVDG
jgi:phage gp29-like protein